jgi:hypothetical protein
VRVGRCLGLQVATSQGCDGEQVPGRCTGEADIAPMRTGTGTRPPRTQTTDATRPPRTGTATHPRATDANGDPCLLTDIECIEGNRPTGRSTRPPQTTQEAITTPVADATPTTAEEETTTQVAQLTTINPEDGCPR